MHRCFVPQLVSFAPAPGVQVPIDESESHHALRVRRLRPGEPVELFDGAGCVATGALDAAGKAAFVRIDHVQQVAAPQPQITVAAAAPKGSLIDDMVPQLSQLGADVFIPLITQRSVVEPRTAKMERLQRACIESAKQCGRAWLMEVRAPVPFAELLSSADYDLRLIATQQGSPLEDIRAQLADAQRVLVLVGPEGGWTSEELETARQHGCTPWRLGPLVMRIETAAVAAIAILRYLAGSHTSTR